MLSVREVAERIGVSVPTVRVWAWRERFPGAVKIEDDRGSYWQIPESAIEDFELGQAGRPLKPDSELKQPRRPSRRKDLLK